MKRSYDGFRPRISCSTLADSAAICTFIREHYGKMVPSAMDARCNMLVFGPEGVKSITTDFIVALSRGMWVVHEQWLITSHAAGHYVAPAYYTPDVLGAWELALADVINTR